MCWTEYFTSSRNPHHDELLKAETRLKSDADRDVRYFAGLSPQTSIEHHDTVRIMVELRVYYIYKRVLKDLFQENYGQHQQ